MDGVVVKRFVGEDARRRLDLEAAALRALVGRLPVPHVLAVDAERLAVTLQHLERSHGHDVIDRAGASVLRATGEMARRIHGIVDVDVGTARHGSGGVLLHGDFGPQNLLFGRDDTVVVGVLDWEFVHFGDALEDLMWAEWIVRTHHPEHVGHLGEMYIAYGRCWSWADRQRAMVGRCDDLRKRSHGPAGDLWTRRLNNTSRWSE